ncbi:7794_t:CDS:2, partial [Funneliformis geosporum]
MEVEELVRVEIISSTKQMTETPYNLPNKKLSKEQYSYYFLPEGTTLSEGLALIYTHKMILRFLSGIQAGWCKRLPNERAVLAYGNLAYADNQESRAYIVFSALAHMNARMPVSHVIELTYLGNILGKLKDAFGWKSSELCAVIDVEDKFEEDIKKWNKQQVAKFLKSALNLDEKYIRKIQEQEINGLTFLLLNEKTLTRRPGPFEFPFVIAIAILEL